MRISDWSSDVCSSDLALNDLIEVGGDLALDGATINVSVPTSGSFGPGIYRVFNYGGDLLNYNLGLGALPGGSDVSVQTSVAGQVNIVNSAGLSFSFWDGDAGPKFNDTFNGRSEAHTSELQSLMRLSSDVFFLKNKYIHQQTQ